MAVCVIECAPELQKRVGSSSSNSAAVSLRPMALPTDITKSSILGTRSRGTKRSAPSSTSQWPFPSEDAEAPSSWTAQDEARKFMSMAAKFSSQSISGKEPSKPSFAMSSNDPSDVLLHQLSQVCDKAQRNAPPSDEPMHHISINAVLEADRNSSTLKSTMLAKHFISCFIVGGEIRLCSPQIYSVIMKDVHENDVSHMIRTLCIVDHMASQEQLISLKVNCAIPPSAGTCALMTKTNAERLVGALIDPVNYRMLPADKRDKFEPVLVEHDCFGGCEGRLFSTLYPGPCVECLQCKCLMTTEAFSRHSHQLSAEKETICHWGFDAANWPKYIRLHQLAENNQESIDLFTSFIKNCSFQQPHLIRPQQQNYLPPGEDTLEDNLEVLAKKHSMISAPLSALAILAQQQQQLLQHQQQQQHASTSSFGNNNGIGAVSAPSSLPTTSFMPSSSATTTGGPSSSSNAHHHPPQLSPAVNIPSSATTPIAPPPPSSQSSSTNQQQISPSLLQLLGSNIQNPQILQQLHTLINQQQQQQQATNNNFTAIINALAQQHQFQSTLSSLRSDESEIPRKRAHTISNPALPMREKPGEFSMSDIGFGMLQADHQLMGLLRQVTDSETFLRVIDLINFSIAQRIQPVLDNNAELRKENQRLKEELQIKSAILSKVATAGLQQHQQQQRSSNSFPLPSSMIPGSSSHHNVHQQQIAEQDSDIEIDDSSTN